MSRQDSRKIAVVSGGASGIGRAAVFRFLTDGYYPIILDRNGTAGAESLAAFKERKLEGQFIEVDLMQKPAVSSAFGQILSTHGRIDVLVNLAGGTFYKGPIHEVSVAQWKECLDLNLKTTFLCCQAVIRPMKEIGRGTIINTASNFAVTGGAERTHYAASKAAIIAFSKSLAAELAPYGIRVNAIAPGLTGTERVRGNYTEAQWTELGKTLPMGRAAKPEEIAEGILFLAGEESDYVTGATLHVNGGMVMP